MRKWTKSGSTASQNATVWSAIKAGTPVHISMEFAGQGITLTDEDVSIDTGVTLTDIFNGDTDLVFGKTVSARFQTRILNSSRVSGLRWTGVCNISFNITIGTTVYTLDIGEFYGEQPKNVTTARYIEYTAYDNMRKFDVSADDFVANLTYPVTINQIFTQLCAFVGVTAGSTTGALSPKNRSFASAPVDMSGYTCRDILGWIAEACGCYAVINGNACDLKWFTDNTAHVVTPTEEFGVESADLNQGLTWDEFDALSNAEQESMTLNDIAGYREAYAVDQLQIKQIDSDNDINYPAVMGGNIYTISGNPYMPISSNSQRNAYVKPIFDRLANFGGYIPYSLECVGDPAVQAGDIITADINGVSVAVPIFVKTMYWGGVITDIYEATGQIPRSSYNGTTGKQSIMESNALKMYVSSQCYTRKSGIEITEDGVSMSGNKFVEIETGDGNKWRYSDIGFTLDYDDDEFYKYKLWIGEGRRGSIAQKATTAINVSSFARYEGIGGNEEVTYYEMMFYNTKKIYAYDEYIFGNYALVWGFGKEDNFSDSLYSALMPMSLYGMLGSADYPWSRAYIDKFYGADGTVKLFPSCDDDNDGIEFTLDPNYVYCQKASNSAKDVMFRGSFEGGVVGQTTSITNLDNMLTPGHYWLNSSAMVNKPSTLANNVYCEIWITKAPASVAENRHQIIIAKDEIYIRTRYNDGSFASWYRLQGTAV